jgi:hypothetical protein
MSALAGNHRPHHRGTSEEAGFTGDPRCNGEAESKEEPEAQEPAEPDAGGSRRRSARQSRGNWPHGRDSARQGRGRKPDEHPRGQGKPHQKGARHGRPAVRDQGRPHRLPLVQGTAGSRRGESLHRVHLPALQALEGAQAHQQQLRHRSQTKSTPSAASCSASDSSASEYKEEAANPAEEPLRATPAGRTAPKKEKEAAVEQGGAGMRMIRPEQLELLRKTYPDGTRVELVRMDDVQAPPIGTKGTVYGIDDTGSLLVHWDNGSGLNVIYGEDIVRKVVTDMDGKVKEQILAIRDTGLTNMFDLPRGAAAGVRPRILRAGPLHRGAPRRIRPLHHDRGILIFKDTESYQFIWTN